MYCIYICTDKRGSFPWLQLGDKTPPKSNVRWKLVARTEDSAEASLMMQRAHEECYGKRDSTAGHT